jgi:hypothetical protein
MTGRQLSVTGNRLPVTASQILVTGNRLPVTEIQLPVMAARGEEVAQLAVLGVSPAGSPVSVIPRV